MKGRRILASLDKYYLSDIGHRYYLLGNKQIDFGHILENVVEYYQIAYTVLDSEWLLNK